MHQNKAQYSAAEGILFFTYGRGYLLRMAICIMSLREHYDGPVTLMILKGDPDSELIKSAMSTLKVDVIDFEMHLNDLKSFTSSKFKHRILAVSPYEITLLCDIDLLFLASPQPLLNQLASKEVLVTSKSQRPWSLFMDPAKFIVQFEEALGTREATRISEGLKHNEYVNIGVIGVRNPKESLFLKDWTQAIDGFSIKNSQHKDTIDGCYVSAIYHNYDHIKVGPEWNYVDNPTKIPAETKVLHYIGDLHRGTMDLKGRLWQRALTRHQQNLCIKVWAKFDPAIENSKELKLKKTANLSPFRASLIYNENFSGREPLIRYYVLKLQLCAFSRGIFNLVKITANLGMRSVVKYMRYLFNKRRNPALKLEL